MAIFSTFSPSSMSSDLVEGVFVQREPIAERLVDIFAVGSSDRSKHNVLLVGPRGIGKSHLVSLVYHRLKASLDLREKPCIAYLREDEWGINSFLDLLLRVLQVTREEEGLPLIDQVGELSGLDTRQAETHVWDCLRKILGHRTLLLIIENLDVVFDKVGEDGQRRWRALIQTSSRWAILATTPALFSAVSRQISPFYGFFEIIHLEPLSFNEALDLLLKLARWNKDEKTASFLETATGRARVKAVQHLAGGNHRIFVIFYDFLNQSGSAHFVTPLLKTVDALTPYYQAQMSLLSPQQQKIINFLCEHRSPATVSAIAKGCIVSHQTAAGQLGQLRTRRYVRVDRIGRESFYELTEPLLRICVEAKTHRERPLYLLVDFIRYWFSREELERRLSGTDDSSVEKPYFLAALEKYEKHDAHVHLNPEIAPLCIALTKRTGTKEQLQVAAQELAELGRIAEDWFHYVKGMLWLHKVHEVIPTLEGVLEQHPDNFDALRALGWAYLTVDSKDRANELVDRAIKINPHSGLVWMDKGDVLNKSKRRSEALEAYDRAVREDPRLQTSAAVKKCSILMDLRKFRAVRTALSPCLSKGKTRPGVFFYYGISLAQENNFLEALPYFEKATAAFENDHATWANMGVILFRLGRYDEALGALDRALTLDSDNRVALHYRGEVLFKTGRYQEATETLPPEDLSHNIFHRFFEIASSEPTEERLKHDLLELDSFQVSKAWKDAFLGGLTEFASYVACSKEPHELEQLQVWNAVLRSLFCGEARFSVLLAFFDVMTRVKVFDDRKALLELPREQRLLLMRDKGEEAFLNSGTDN